MSDFPDPENTCHVCGKVIAVVDTIVRKDRIYYHVDCFKAFPVSRNTTHHQLHQMHLESETPCSKATHSSKALSSAASSDPHRPESGLSPVGFSTPPSTTPSPTPPAPVSAAMPDNILPSGLSKAAHVARILQMQDARSSHPIGPLIQAMTHAEREGMAGLLRTPPAPVSATMPVDLDTLKVGDTIVRRSGMTAQVMRIQHRNDKHLVGTDVEFVVDATGESISRTYRRDGRWSNVGETPSDIVEVRPCDTEPDASGENPAADPNPEMPPGVPQETAEKVQAYIAANPAPVDPAVTLLDEAKRIVCGQRSQQYGPPKRGLDNIAKMWTEYLRQRGVDFTASAVALTPDDVAMLMVLLKVVRAGNSYKRDNYVDIAGYAAIAESCHAPHHTP